MRPTAAVTSAPLRAAWARSAKTSLAPECESASDQACCDHEECGENLACANGRCGKCAASVTALSYTCSSGLDLHLLFVANVDFNGAPSVTCIVTGVRSGGGIIASCSEDLERRNKHRWKRWGLLTSLRPPLCSRASAMRGVQRTLATSSPGPPRSAPGRTTRRKSFFGRIRCRRRWHRARTIRTGKLVHRLASAFGAKARTLRPSPHEFYSVAPEPSRRENRRGGRYAADKDHEHPRQHQRAASAERHVGQCLLRFARCQQPRRYRGRLGTRRPRCSTPFSTRLTTTERRPLRQ